MICLLLCGAHLQAQSVLTLEQYREQVVDYSNQLKISLENTTIAAERVKMVRSGAFPSLGLAANASYQQGNAMNFGTTTLKNYNYNSTLTLQQNVYGGGAVRAATQSADINYTIAQMSEVLTLQNTVYAADMTYWAFAASAKQRAIAATFVDIVRHLYQIVQIRFTDGYISRTDLLMVETRLNEAELQRIAADQLYRDALIQLGTLLGLDTVPEYAVGDSISAIPALEKILAQPIHLDDHPEYQMAALTVDLQNQNIKVVRSQYNPQFHVGIQAVYGTPSLNFSGTPKFYGVAFASLNVPLFMGGERRHNVALTRAGIRSSEYALTQTQDRIRGDLSGAVNSLQQTIKQIEIADRNLSVAKENLDLNTFSYSEGRLPILDVLQSQLAWIQAYTAFVQSNYSYQTAVASYYKAAGIFR